MGRLGRRWLLLLALLALPVLCHAEFVGFTAAEFEPYYRPQRESLWCWASCAEMVLAAGGIDLPQETIVQRVKGQRVNAVGTPAEMLGTVNGIFRDARQRQVVVSGQYVIGAPLTTVLYNHLKRKRPVILTFQASSLSSHAVVLHGVEATVSAEDGVRVTTFYVADSFMYRSTTGANGLVSYTPDPALRFRVFHPQDTPNGVFIEAGLITGMILVDGQTL